MMFSASMVFTNVPIPRSRYSRNQPSDFKETRVRKGASLGRTYDCLQPYHWEVLLAFCC